MLWYVSLLHEQLCGGESLEPALHLMNIRGKLLIENCHMEAPGDDCLNFATLLEKIGDYSPDIPKAMTLNTTDNRYYYHNILKGDALQVLDTKANRFIGVANVEKVEFIAQRRSHRVLLNRALPALVAANVVVINLNRMTLSTVIRNNLKTPYMRNAMLVRIQNMTIESDKIDGPHGGVMGVNFTYSMGESARMRNVNITGNTFSGFQSSAIIMGNACRNQQGVLIVQDFPITNNMFQLGPLWAVVDLDEYDPRYDVSVDRAQGCFEAMPRTRCRKNDGPEKIACTASTQYDGVLVFEQFRKMIAAMLTNLMLVFSAH